MFLKLVHEINLVDWDQNLKKKERNKSALDMEAVLLLWYTHLCVSVCVSV